MGKHRKVNPRLRTAAVIAVVVVVVATVLAAEKLSTCSEYLRKVWLNTIIPAVSAIRMNAATLGRSGNFRPHLDAIGVNGAGAAAVAVVAVISVPVAYASAPALVAASPPIPSSTHAPALATGPPAATSPTRSPAKSAPAPDTSAPDAQPRKEAPAPAKEAPAPAKNAPAPAKKDAASARQAPAKKPRVKKAPAPVRKAAPAPAKKAPARPPADPVDRWISKASAILAQHGTHLSAGDIDAVKLIIEHESGGDPRAVNNWDSNAAAGHPSMGLMQTIPSTFDAYALGGKNRHILNPVANIIAGVRYAISRYGSLANVPGVEATRSGGSYVGY